MKAVCKWISSFCPHGKTGTKLICSGFNGDNLKDIFSKHCYGLENLFAGSGNNYVLCNGSDEDLKRSTESPPISEDYQKTHSRNEPIKFLEPNLSPLPWSSTRSSGMGYSPLRCEIESRDNNEFNKEMGNSSHSKH